MWKSEQNRRGWVGNMISIKTVIKYFFQLFFSLINLLIGKFEPSGAI